MSNQIVALNTRDLLSGSGKYLVPMYQRNYAWGEGEITQLIQDIIDCQLANPEKIYHIGTLVVHRNEQGDGSPYETVDGQQRLTTLSLIAACLKHSKESHNYAMAWYKALPVAFENRSNSTQTFRALFDDGSTRTLSSDDINSGLVKGYELIKKILPQKLKENKCQYDAFCKYLFSNVQIMRVQLPSDTDLNHYFEIMNTRGEQLEKHEILKAKLMNVLSDEPTAQNCLAGVWDACSDMERYVQMGFTPDMRGLLFDEKHWRKISINNTEDLFDIFSRKSQVQSEGVDQGIDDILNSNTQNANKKVKEEIPERFHSVINFQNFLLHALSVHLNKSIALDDKRLIDQFEEFLLGGTDTVAEVKKFTYSLLKCRYLFDHYIIKREYLGESDHWSLKHLKANESKRQKSANYVNSFDEVSNRRILMLLAAFHTATPTLVYKHWLNAALLYLYQSNEVVDTSYLAYLEGLSKAFVFDRFLAYENSLDYADIIFTNKGECLAEKSSMKKATWFDRLKYGEIQNNFVFNYLDYLLWVTNENKDVKQKDKKIQAFEFTFRSSVEHYAPQTPVDGEKPLADHVLHSFGNLCLISHSKNSKLSNHSAEAKKDYYKNNPADSIKQHLMMSETEWNETAIQNHYEAMEAVFENALVEVSV